MEKARELAIYQPPQVHLDINPWITGLARMGLLMTGANFNQLGPLGDYVVPIDAVRDIILKHPSLLDNVDDLTDPAQIMADFTFRLIPVCESSEPLLSNEVIADANLEQSAGYALRDDSRLYCGVAVDDILASTLAGEPYLIKPWSAIGTEDEPLIGIYENETTRYIPWANVVRSPLLNWSGGY